MTSLRELVHAAERRIVALALIEHGHNRTYTARALGISRRTLLNKIKGYKLITRLDINEAAEVKEAAKQE